MRRLIIGLAVVGGLALAVRHCRQVMRGEASCPCTKFVGEEGFPCGKFARRDETPEDATA